MGKNKDTFTNLVIDILTGKVSVPQQTLEKIGKIITREKMKYQCGFCDFESEDPYVVSKHWDKCKERLALDRRCEDEKD